MTCLREPERPAPSVFDRDEIRQVHSELRHRACDQEQMARQAENADKSQHQRIEAERYREAAEAALDQLDWCIGYLHRIRKSPLADALARNRSEIRTRLT